MDKKYVFLLLLVAQNTSKTLILRFALGGKGKGKGNFLYSAAVLATEGLKAASSCLWVINSGGSISSIVRFMRLEWRTLLRVMIPAGVYNCQQMLEFVALSRLEAPVFSVIVQTKLLTTALFSWLVLGKRLHRVQLIALVLLMVGVILAQMRDGRPMGSGGGSASRREVTIGVVATLTIATLSGFAAVYTERVLKHATLQAHSMASNDSLPYMQIQMAVASLLIIGVFAVVCDFSQIVEYGLWRGFDHRAVTAVASSALGGLIVSAVLKYADSVLKGYATATSVILTGVLSSVFFGTSLDLHFILAVVNVCCSIALYSNPSGSTAVAAAASASTGCSSSGQCAPSSSSGGAGPAPLQGADGSGSLGGVGMRPGAGSQARETDGLLQSGGRGGPSPKTKCHA